MHKALWFGFQLLTMTTANTCSRLGTSSGELWKICTASGSGGPGWDSSTATSDSDDLGGSGNARDEEKDRESLWDERERKLRLVLLDKESVGDGGCFGQILQWAARDEHKVRFT